MIVVQNLSYIIRSFRPEDLQQVVRINQTCLPENYPESFFLLIYSSFPEGFLDVTTPETGEIVGYTMNRVESSVSNYSKNPLKRVKKGHVISIAVMPFVRHQRLGYRLMVSSLDEMVKQGAEECFLEVRQSNTPAITLYEQMGFVKIKLLKKYYSDNENAYLMAVHLPLSPNIQ